MTFLNKIFKSKPAVGNKSFSRETQSSKSEEKETVAARPAMHSAGALAVGILRAPHLTEKTSAGAEQNKYVFLAEDRANKVEIKKAVERRYGVKVVKLNVLNTAAKKRRRGRQVGWKPGFKKAIVTLRKGQSIELT